MLVSETLKNLEYLERVLANKDAVQKITSALVLLAYSCEEAPKDKDKRKNLEASTRFTKLVKDIMEERGVWERDETWV